MHSFGQENTQCNQRENLSVVRKKKNWRMKGTLSNWLPVNPPLTATASLTTGSCFFRHTRKKIIICSSFTGTNPAAAVKDKYIEHAVSKNNLTLRVYLVLLSGHSVMTDPYLPLYINQQ